MDVRLVDTTVAEAAGRDLGENLGEGGALLLDRLRVVEVLVAEVLDGGRQVSKEDCLEFSAPLDGCRDKDNSQTLLSPTSSAISMFAPSKSPSQYPTILTDPR